MTLPAKLRLPSGPSAGQDVTAARVERAAGVACGLGPRDLLMGG